MREPSEITTATILAQEKLVETELGRILPLGETGGEFLPTPLGSQATRRDDESPGELSVETNCLAHARYQSCGKSRFRFCGREGKQKKGSRSAPMSFRQAPQGSEDGFTLIEILLAVSLIAMMAALVFGSLYMSQQMRSKPHERNQPMSRSFAAR